MENQKEAFLRSEGDAYYQRNVRNLLDVSLPNSDEVTKAIQAIDIEPRSVLEVGCANGFRLAALSANYSAKCYGIDLSQMAIDDGRARFPNIALTNGTADCLPYESKYFDLVIMGSVYICATERIYS